MLNILSFGKKPKDKEEDVKPQVRLFRQKSKDRFHFLKFGKNKKHEFLDAERISSFKVKK